MSGRLGPRAAQRPVRHQRFGVAWDDELGWLRDSGWPIVQDPEILAHLEAENAWYEAAMAPHRALVEQLHAELIARIPADDRSVPVQEAGFLYQWRYLPGAQYRIWLRRPVGTPEEAATVILDENRLAAGRGYFSLRGVAASPDGRLLAYATDEDGSERYALHLADLDTGQVLADLVPNISGSLAWSADSRFLFYVELDPNLRPAKVRAHRIGTDAATDRLVLEEPDPAFFLEIEKSLDGRLIQLTSATYTISETWLVEAAAPELPARCVTPRRAGHRYRVQHQDGRLWILTNDRGSSFRLVTAPLATPGEAAWQEVLPADPRCYLRALACFDGFTALLDRSDGLDGLRIHTEQDGWHRVALPEPVASLGFGDNREAASPAVRLHFSSMVTPLTVLDYDVGLRRLVSRKVQPIPSGYDPGRYVTTRLMAEAADGARVPITLFHARGYPRDGSGRLYLYGYGSYGIGLDIAFNATRLSLVDRGFCFALAHVRGGDELGPDWWRAGQLEHKPNTFGDFIAAAEHLIQEGYGREGAIAIKGVSAGGMLVGAVLNQRPELWRCAVAEVPFVDVLNTMLDGDLLLTPIEWPEWGNPLLDEQAFHTIRGYAPYENVRAASYPHLLVTAALSDPRVPYWEPAKWVARLRARRSNANLLLLRTHMDAGHFGRSGRHESLRDLAEQFAFFLHCFEGE